MQVVVGGHRIAYETTGSGPTIVLVPGLLQAAADWHRTGYVAALSGDHRVVTVDPLGFGTSDKPHDPAAYTFDARVDHLLAVLDAEQVEQAIMWGYSFGGMQVEAFTLREPDRVSAAILGGTLAGLSAQDRRNIAEPEIETFRANDWDRVFATVGAVFAEELRPMLRERNDLLAVAASWEGSWQPFSAEGRTVAVPMLNYVGEKETWYPVALAVAEDRGLTFETILDADHGRAFLDTDAVVPRVRTFLER